ncbi:helix-turn-helix domain-containing protein, partial [Frankia sp. Cr1]|uniref:helix-turn-helix domain-containing protein n=1 Tax=Frankia sp. Cr1 TaxID=3073931 RepID=UPI003A10024A
MDDDPLVRLGAGLRRHRLEAGLTQTGLAAMVDGYYDRESLRTIISKCERGRAAPSEAVMGELDRLLGAGGGLVGLLRQARAKALRAQVARLYTVVDVPETESAPWAGEEETQVVDQDRREFGLTLAAVIAAAADASHAMATADPSPLTLEEMEAAADLLTAQLYDLPKDILLRRAAGQWHQAHQALSRLVSGPVRARLLVLAGGLACRAAALGRRTGDATVLRHFGVLAGQYAAESGDPLLVGDVACLRSRTAFQAAQY